MSVGADITAKWPDLAFRWLDTSEILDILLGWRREGFLLQTEVSFRPPNGSAFLYPQVLVEPQLADGYTWRPETVDTTQESVLGASVAGQRLVLHCVSIRAQARSTFVRRVYWLETHEAPGLLLDAAVLVQYRDEDPTVASRMQAAHLLCQSAIAVCDALLDGTALGSATTASALQYGGGGYAPQGRIVAGADDDSGQPRTSMEGPSPRRLSSEAGFASGVLPGADASSFLQSLSAQLDASGLDWRTAVARLAAEQDDPPN